MKGKNPVTIFIVLIILGVLGMAVVVTADVIRNLRPATETLPADTPTAGIGRDAESADVGIWLASVCADDVPSLAEYTEGDGPAPEWYRPDEPMAVEWREVERYDIGCPDWNLESTLFGWDGHSMEAWEMDIFSRVMYLEFWGTSDTCCEAGADAILRLWESGYYGETMYGVLSAETESGGPVFETWDAVWGTEYDPVGLAEMRSLCEERFQSGPEWIAPFFRTGHYHDWAVPCYCFPEDNVYFSTGKGW